MVSETFPLLKFVHIISAVVMAAPLYLIIVSNERGKLGPPLNPRLERYMENVIKRQPMRCYVYLATILVSGLALLALSGRGLGALLSNSIVALKALFLFTLAGLITYVHTQIQPRIEELLTKVPEGGAPPEDVAKQIGALRLRRRKLGSFCLFLVITTVVLGVSLTTALSAPMIVGLIAVGALFSWRAYSSLITFGWI